MRFVTYHLKLSGLDPKTLETVKLEEIGMISVPIEIDEEKFRNFETGNLLMFLIEKSKEGQLKDE